MLDRKQRYGAAFIFRRGNEYRTRICESRFRDRYAHIRRGVFPTCFRVPCREFLFPYVTERAALRVKDFTHAETFEECVGRQDARLSAANMSADEGTDVRQCRDAKHLRPGFLCAEEESLHISSRIS